MSILLALWAFVVIALVITITAAVIRGIITQRRHEVEALAVDIVNEIRAESAVKGK